MKIETAKGTRIDIRQFLSRLDIDIDKDWAGKRIYNLTEISIGDIIFSNGWRLTEIDNGIVLLNNKNKVIRRWEDA